MPHNLSYIEGEEVIASEDWTRSLEEATDYAQEAVASGTAERIEIRDETGKLIFSHPRLLRAART